MRLEQLANLLHIKSTPVNLLVQLIVEPVNIVESLCVKGQRFLHMARQVVNVELLIVNKHSKKVLFRIQQFLYVLPILPKSKCKSVIMTG